MRKLSEEVVPVLEQSVVSLEREIGKMKARAVSSLKTCLEQEPTPEVLDGLMVSLRISRDKLIKLESEKQAIQNILSYLRVQGLTTGD